MICPDCGYDELEVKKSIERNEVIEGGRYCPDCGSDFDEGVTLQWDDIEFPVWVEMESYNDHWELWDTFRWDVNYYDGDRNRSAPSDMKYTVFSVYYKVEEDGSVEGPYDSKNGDLLAN